MKTVNLNFNGFEFSITETEKGFNINDLRKQVVEFKKNFVEPEISGFKTTQDCYEWKENNLSDAGRKFYEVVTTRGRGAGTFTNEMGVYAYSSWLNEEFGFAVIEAFKHLANGDVEAAIKVVKKVVRTAIRQDNVDYTNHFASRVSHQFGNQLIAPVMKTIQNHINRSLFGVETEELREMARQHSGRKAKKIAHREFYDDSTIIRITSVTTACIQKFEDLYGTPMSPRELLMEMQTFIDQYINLCGGSRSPTYKKI